MREAGLIALLLLASCRTIPDKIEQPPVGHAIPPAPGTRLAKLEATVLDRHGAEGADAFHPIRRNGDHVHWLLALIDNAETSLDLQYYYWGDEPAGSIIMDRVMRTADRGVKVRLIVDDMMSGQRDRGLASIDLHPNIEVRIFNPARNRSHGPRPFEYGFSKRLKMRMHNKLTVADNRFCLVGGRNLAAEYFGLSNEFNFQDFTMLACGGIVRKASAKYDLYWNSPRIYPAHLLVKNESPEFLEERKAVWRQRAETADVLAEYPRAPTDGSGWLDRLPDIMVGGNGTIVADKPERQRDEDDHSIHELRLLLNEVETDITWVLAYFVPNQRFLDEVKPWIDAGVRIRILTNSMASNDQPYTNPVLRKWRKRILEAGIELHELRHDAAIKSFAETAPAKGKFLALHAKTAVFDRRSVYIGSMNVTPRTLDLRSLENGIFVGDCPALAEPVYEFLDSLFKPENSWRVGIDEKGKLYWECSTGRVTKQPARSSGQRFTDWFLGLLPIDDQV